MKLALDYKYSIIRILQDNIWFDNIDWKQILENLINNLIASNIAEVVYASDNKCYDTHKKDLSEIIESKISLMDYYNNLNEENEIKDIILKPRLNLIPSKIFELKPKLNLILSNIPELTTKLNLITPSNITSNLSRPKPKLKLITSNI